MVLRFIVGYSPSAEAEAEMAAEAQLHGDFMRLPLVEAYDGLPNKTRTFFHSVAQAYQADWIVKMDDDVYMMPERLHLAAKQWDTAGAEYVGCMANGDVSSDEADGKWYEPRHELLGREYPLHAYGSMYALSGGVVERVVVRSFDTLRLLANEDTSVGAWMLSHEVRHFDDERLCVELNCTAAAVGVGSIECAGLCDPVADLYRLHGSKACRAAVPDARLMLSDAVLVPRAAGGAAADESERMWA
jgi:hypothetical protein